MATAPMVLGSKSEWCSILSWQVINRLAAQRTAKSIAALPEWLRDARNTAIGTNGNRLEKPISRIDKTITEVWHGPSMSDRNVITDASAKRLLKDSRGHSQLSFTTLAVGDSYTYLDLKQWGQYDYSSIVDVDAEIPPNCQRLKLRRAKCVGDDEVVYEPSWQIPTPQPEPLSKWRSLNQGDNGKLKKDQQAMVIGSPAMQKLMWETIVKTLGKKAKIDRDWILSKVRAIATEDIYNLIMVDGRKIVGKKNGKLIRAEPFKYSNGLSGFCDSVLAYTVTKCKGWSDEIDAGREEWDFKKHTGLLANEEVESYDVLHGMREAARQTFPSVDSWLIQWDAKKKKRKPTKTFIKHVHNVGTLPVEWYRWQWNLGLPDYDNPCKQLEPDTEGKDWYELKFDNLWWYNREGQKKPVHSLGTEQGTQTKIKPLTA